MELYREPAAAWYGFREMAAEGHHPGRGGARASSASLVGFVLMAHTIREAIASGADENRLLRGGEEYKYRFAAEDRGLEDRRPVATGPRGTTALSGAKVSPGAAKRAQSVDRPRNKHVYEAVRSTTR